MTWLAVAVGGAIGSIARHAVNMLFAHVLERSVPYATAAVNIAGSIVIGALAGVVATARIPMPPNVRTFVFVGILGGFTTFSSYMLDTFTLAHGGEHTVALLNVGAQTLLGFLGVWSAYYAAVWIG